MSDGPTEVVVDDAHDGERLDRALSALLGVSRARIQKDILSERVLLNGALPGRGAKTSVRSGDRLVHDPAPPEIVKLVAEDIAVPILFEDEDLIVVDKPAGMVVHPALGHPRGTLVNALLHHIQRAPDDDNLRPGIVHRLDQGTTGVIVVAKHPEAHGKLSAAFKNRNVDKSYDALTVGVPRPTEATIETLYGRHPHDRKKFSSRVIEGKSAITHYRVADVFPGIARVEVRLETGRTHQIRVHLSDKGHPLVGDAVYAGRRRVRDIEVKDAIQAFDRPALHARRLTLPHPTHGRRMTFEAPWPRDLTELLEALTQIRAARS